MKPKRQPRRRAAKKAIRKAPGAAKKKSLLGELQALRAKLDQAMRQKWQRSLPFEELISDRWQRAESLGFAKEASIYSSAMVYGDVEVGRKSWIGPQTILDGSGGRIAIGEYCNVSAGVQIYSHDTIHWCLSGGKEGSRKGSVVVGDCTYIGPNSVVQQGVTIGDHCVIGANSLVNRSIPPYSFAVGSPCRVIGKVVRRADGSFTFSKDRPS